MIPGRGVIIMALTCFAAPLMAASLDQDLHAIIKQHHLTGDPSKERDIPNISSPKAQLGMRLFFNKALGGSRDSACVTCHHPLLGGGDGLALSIGVGAIQTDKLGEGRTRHDGMLEVPRNAPSSFNTALWDNAMFWDGRVESLNKVSKSNGVGGGVRTPDTSYGRTDKKAGDNLVSAQAHFPVTSVGEMRGTNFEIGNTSQSVRQHLAGRLGGWGAGAGELPQPDYWREWFYNVYGGDKAHPEQLVTAPHVFDAIGEYQRSQVFINSPWKHYVQGDVKAISDKAKRGALLFFRPYNEGGANCVACHSGDFFTNEQFYTLAMPQIGPGMRGGVDNTNDFGRGYETGRAEDRFSFRTPSLLNVAKTSPYGLAGAYLTLKAVVKHHLNPKGSIDNFDFTAFSDNVTENIQRNTHYALNKLYADQKSKKTPLQFITLEEHQLDALLAFLTTLTDTCIQDKACLAAWMPPIGEDPNGLQVNFGGAHVP